MSFIYLVSKLYYPPPPGSVVPSEMTERSSFLSPKSDVRTPRSKLVSQQQQKPPASPHPSQSQTPQEEVTIYNFDMEKTQMLLDMIKEKHNYQEVDVLDLVNFKTGECCMIHTAPFEDGSKYLKKGEKYFPCQVKIQTSLANTSITVTTPNKKAPEPTQPPEPIKTFTSLVTGNASEQIIAITDPTKKNAPPKKK